MQATYVAQHEPLIPGAAAGIPFGGGFPQPPDTPPPTIPTDPLVYCANVWFLSGFDGASVVAVPNTPPPPPPPQQPLLRGIDLMGVVGVAINSITVLNLPSGYTIGTYIPNLPPGMTVVATATTLVVSGTPTASGVFTNYPDVMQTLYPMPGSISGISVGPAVFTIRIAAAPLPVAVNLNNRVFGPGVRGTPFCSYALTRAGLIAGVGSRTQYITDEWFIGAPTSLDSATAGQYEYLVTMISHTPFVGGVLFYGNYGSWTNINAGNGFQLINTIAGTIAFVTFQLDIRPVGGAIRATATITLKHIA